MAQSNQEGSHVSELTAGNIAFCKNLYNILRKTPGNIFFSPASLEFALAVVYSGADGNTAEQIKTHLKLPESRDKTFASISSVLETLTSSQNVTLKVANALFAQKKYELKQPFLDIAKKYFNALVSGVDFSTDESRKTINEFVAKETQQKIKELFAPGTLDPLTKLVIVNAIYFKGNWALKFNPAETSKGQFHLNKKDNVTVDFMRKKDHYRVGYPSELDATIVVLPYQDNKMSMVLIVPHEIDGLKVVEEQLAKVDLEALVRQTHKQEIVLVMPKFKLTQSLELSDNLSELGMSDMFSERANLSGISNDPLYVSQVVQKCYIEVNEEGAEAAAATGIAMSLRMMPLPPAVIKAEYPFLFFIIVEDNSIIFAGRVSNPSEHS